MPLPACRLFCEGHTADCPPNDEVPVCLSAFVFEVVVAMVVALCVAVHCVVWFGSIEDSLLVRKLTRRLHG